jgi:hypothetical protein
MGNSRTPSSAKQKMQRYRADPYKRSGPMARIWLSEPMCGCGIFPEHPGSRCPCDNHNEPGAPRVKDPRDEARKRASSLDGGFGPDMCREHHMRLSANGTCQSCEIPVSRNGGGAEKQFPQRRFVAPERFTARRTRRRTPEQRLLDRRVNGG